MADSKDDRISGLEVKLELVTEMYDRVHAERDQLQGEVGALREERETLLTRITELEVELSDARTGLFSAQWVFNNLHNVGTPQFQEYAKAAAEDVDRALAGGGQ